MAPFRNFASISALLLAFGTSTLVYTQANEKHNDKAQSQGKQSPSGDKHQLAPPAHQDAKSALQNSRRKDSAGDKNKLPGQPKQMERTHEQEQQQQRVQQRAWQERRANHWEYEHRTWKQRGGYNGYRIPDDYFRDHYGNSHSFRVYSLPFIYEAGNPRFQYDGYWFTLLDPFPENWGGKWYESDDVYVDYNGDGYYLFNRGYPGRPGIAISVSI